MAVYRVVQTEQHPRFGQVQDTVSRHSSKAYAVAAVRDMVKKWRRSTGGSAWREEGPVFGYELRQYQQPKARLTVVREG